MGFKKGDLTKVAVVLFGAFFIFSCDLNAVMLNLDYEIDAGITGASGSSEKLSGGEYTLSQCLGQSSGIKWLSSSVAELYAGYLGAYLGDGKSPYILSSNVTAQFRGLAPGQSIEIVFSDPMIEESVHDSLKICALRKNDGNRISQVVVGTSTYIHSENKLIFVPTKSLEYNYTYDLEVSTGVRDLEGYCVSKPIKYWFATIMNPSVENVAVLMEGVYTDIAEKTRVKFPKNSFAENLYILVSTSPAFNPIKINPETVQTANKKQIHNRGRYAYPIHTYEITALKEAAEFLSASFAKNTVLEFAYKDEDGFVAGSNPPVFEKTLAIYHLDEKHSLWVKLPSSVVDTENNVVRAETKDFSVFTLMGGASYDLSGAHAFPVPFIPSKGHKEITFTEIGQDWTIKIFTISGELVKKLNYDTTQSPGQYVWNVKNDSGQNVFSGVYIYYISNPEKHKSGKLMIIR